MPKGTITLLVCHKIVDDSYGFIKGEGEGEGDLFFHYNDLQGVQFESLMQGQEVEFEVGRRRDGRPQAINVRLAQAKAE
jgi:cold shock CspA family protein